MLLEKLYDFQKEIVNKYYEKRRFGLFLDMGLGKTILSLSFCEKNDISKIVVISIKSKSEEDLSVKGSFDDYLNQLNFHIYKKDKKNKINLDHFDNHQKSALVINYEALVNKEKDLPNYLYEFILRSQNEKIAIILDESHKIKNSSSIRSKMIKKLINFTDKYARLYLYLLTGTPFTQGFIDLYNQLYLLGLNISKTAFIDKFCIRGRLPGLLEWQQPITGYKNLNQLFELVNQFSITELTENNIKLPEQIFNYVKLPESKEFKLFTRKILPRNNWKNKLKELNIDDKLYNTNPFYRNLDFPDDQLIALTPSSFWMRARQLSSGFQGNENYYKIYHNNKVNKLKEFLSENKDNYVIFYNYTPELKMIFEVCEELGYLIDVYCGDIKDLSHYNDYLNKNDLDKFNAVKRVIISNLNSGSTGKNWQEYHKVIFFSVPLYGVYAQALKRVHRIGQKNTVYYYMFYEDNFLDQSMLEALEDNVEYNSDMFNYKLKEFEQC